MRPFHCRVCDHLIFFENTSCIRCGAGLAYIPECRELGAFDIQTNADIANSPICLNLHASGREYQLCRNAGECGCNWALPVDSGEVYCRSCRLTRMIPDLSRPGHREAWTKLEAAKRRLVANVIDLGLPACNKFDDPEGGLAFEFLADPDPGSGEPPILTGHADGLITINIAEADDAERERRRLQFQEPYRTLLGHFRHEIGHYYWNLLIRDHDRFEEFRTLFGDERQDYGDALKRHHAEGPPADWQSAFISSYATCHPWEDWAESWAHYLHISDTLDTAVASGLALEPARPDLPSLRPDVRVLGVYRADFNQITERWFPLTLILNNMNRAMGLPDAYPFVLSTPVLGKLRFIHEIIGQSSLEPEAAMSL